MKSKIVKGIRAKFFMIFTFSTLLSLICLMIFLKIDVGTTYIDSEKMEGSYILIVLTGFVLLMILFFYIFSRKIINRIEEISINVNEIKEGNLDINIPVVSGDEVGKLAENINIMAKNLKDLMERERKDERIKNEMISSVSHDLRTPLTSLIGYIQLIKNDYEKLQAAPKYVDIAERKCEELKKLIDDLLEYSKVNFQGIKLKKNIVSIKELVEQVMIDFVPQLDNYGMTFNIESSRERIFINADISLIVRLLQNIISNSIFYGTEGKKINIKVMKENKNVIIKISNYGKAILEEDLPYIFERFYRCEKSRNSNTGGKGMGLAIAKRIAEIHEGTITASSNSEETAFEIMLPEYIDISFNN